MSLKYIVEIVLYLDKFMNIELIQQGLYRLHISLESADSKKQKKNCQGIPYDYQLLTDHLDSLDCQPQLLDKTYISQTFYIRYIQEEVCLQELVQFRLELNAYPFDNIYDQQILINIQLMYSDINSPISFKPVNSYKARLNSIYSNVKQYLPVYFDGFHFSQLDIGVFVFPIGNYQFQMSQMLKEDVQKMNQHKQQQSPQINNFNDFLFQISGQNDPQQIDQLYKQYVINQVIIFEKQKKMYIEQFEHLSKQLKKKDIEKQKQLDKIRSEKLNETGFVGKAILDLDELNSYQMSENIKSNRYGVEFQTHLNVIGHYMFDMMYRQIQVIKLFRADCLQYMKAEYEMKLIEFYQSYIFRVQQKADSLAANLDSQMAVNNHGLAKKIRKQGALHRIDIDDYRHSNNEKTMPIIFEQIIQLHNTETKNEQIVSDDSTSTETETIKIKKIPKLYCKQGHDHLLVFVHGFQGNNLDMRVIKNHIQAIFVDYHYLISQANEFMTEQDIDISGRQLAQEIKEYIEMEEIKIKRVYFIGHSMGGVIIRSAIQYLRKYEHCFYMFISLSSPHLGYYFSQSKLVDAGLWYLKRQKTNISLHQLTMSDPMIFEKEQSNTNANNDTINNNSQNSDENADKFFLYKLSKNGSLDNFKHILLFSSHQDNYVPYESARIQQTKSSKNSKKAQIYNQMAENIFKNVKTKQVHRIDVNFTITQQNLDKYIGRAAHIQFLECDLFLRIIAKYYKSLFE